MTRPRAGRARRLLAAAAVVWVAVPAVLLPALIRPPAAWAQKQEPMLSVDIRMTRVWFKRGSPISFEVAVTNRTKQALRGIRASVALYERVRSRSELRTAFGGRLPRDPLQAFTYPLEDLQAGATQRATVEEDLASQRSFQGAPDGVYPLAVTIRRSGSPSVTAVTAAALLNNEPDRRLTLSPVFVLAPPPILGPAGTVEDDTREQLTGIRRRLGLFPGGDLAAGFAVSPYLLEELRAMRASPVRAESAALEEAVGALSARSESLTLPYVYAQLPQLKDLGAGTAAEQIGAGRAATERILGATPNAILFPPELRVDDGVVAAAGRAGMGALLVPGGALSSSSKGLTPAEPFTSADVNLLPTDELLAKDLAGARSDVDVARAAVDTAMIYFEAPGRTRTLAVSGTAFSGSTRFPAFYSAIVDAPWLQVVRPSAAVDRGARSVRAIRSRTDDDPPRSFLDALNRARRSVEDLVSYTVGGNPVTSGLQNALQAAAGTGWWSSDWARGSAWARGIGSVVDAQRKLVSTAESGPVTFTSRRGEIPVTIVNKASYPFRIAVKVTSPKLKFPEGSDRLIDPLDPPGLTVTFAALAEATGTFPLRVTLTSPDGAVQVNEPVEYVVRSTAFNRLALVITLGAAAFLLVWYVRRAVISRRAAPDG